MDETYRGYIGEPDKHIYYKGCEVYGSHNICPIKFNIIEVLKERQSLFNWDEGYSVHFNPEKHLITFLAWREHGDGTCWEENHHTDARTYGEALMEMYHIVITKDVFGLLKELEEDLERNDGEMRKHLHKYCYDRVIEDDYDDDDEDEE